MQRVLLCDVIFQNGLTPYEYVSGHVCKLFIVGNKSEYYRGQVISFMLFLEKTATFCVC